MKCKQCFFFLEYLINILDYGMVLSMTFDLHVYEPFRKYLLVLFVYFYFLLGNNQGSIGLSLQIPTTTTFVLFLFIRSCDISNALLVCSVNGRLLISNITSSEPVISDVPESSVTREWSSVQARSNNQEATFLLVSGEENFLFRPGRNSEIRKLENLLEKGDIYVQTNSQLSKSDVFSVLLIVNRLSPVSKPLFLIIFIMYAHGIFARTMV